MAVRPQQHARLVLRLDQMRLVHGFGHQPDAVATPIGLEVAINGDHDEIVLRVSEDAAQGLGGAYHFIRPALHLDGLADRVLIAEEPRADIAADEDHRGVMLHFLVSDGAAGVHLHIVDGGNVVGDAIQLDGLHAVPLIANPRPPRGHHPELLY